MKVVEWGMNNLPTFVLIADYKMSGDFVELPPLEQKYRERGWSCLSDEEQTILIVLDSLALISTTWSAKAIHRKAALSDKTTLSRHQPSCPSNFQSCGVRRKYTLT